MKIAVLGAGTWGTAISILLSNNGHEVTLWSKISAELEALAKDRKNVPNLPGAVLPDNVILEADNEKTVEGKDVIVFATASPYIRKTAHTFSPLIKEGQKIVNLAKGIEEETLLTLSQVIEEEIPQADVAVLSGPSHAEEVSRQIPTTIVVGARSEETACFLQDIFMSQMFRVYTSPDVIGIEIGASLKNVIALAAGMGDGLGYGDNTKAALMTRGIAEISRLGIKMGGQLETFAGLSGVGDLFVTCMSRHSRNKRAGELIGQGKTPAEALEAVNQVVEGVNSAKAAYALAQKYNVSMPIVEQVNKILFENKPVKEAVADLFLRDKTIENKSLNWR